MHRQDSHQECLAGHQRVRPGIADKSQILSLAAHKYARPDSCPVPRKRGWKLVLKDITGHLQRGSLTLTNTFDHLKKEDVCLYNPK